METRIREILAFLFIVYFIMGLITLMGFLASPETVPYFDLLVAIPIFVCVFFGIIFFIVIPIVSWILGD